MFEITRQWVKANGPWTAKKLEAVGMSWPPEAGWVDVLTFRSISEEAKAQVEQLHIEQLQKKAERATRHERMQWVSHYTWPDGEGGWQGSSRKPAWWDSGHSEGFNKLQKQQGTSLQTKRSGSANKI